MPLIDDDISFGIIQNNIALKLIFYYPTSIKRFGIIQNNIALKRYKSFMTD